MSDKGYKQLQESILRKKTSEKLLERKLREAIKKLGGKALKFSTPYETGYPDRLILMPGGRTYWAELKTTGKKPTEKQLLRQLELRSLGFVSEVIDSIGTLNNFLMRLENERE